VADDAIATDRLDLSELVRDERAFRAWYERALPRVYGVVFDRCGGDRALAEEITQEAFVEAVRNRERFEGRSDPVTWVTSIARHKVADHHRRAARDERRRLRLLSGTAADEEAAWGRFETREDVARALGLLTAGQREVLCLRYLDDLSVAVIAATIGRSESATESLLSRGRESLRRTLGLPGEEGASDV
jgi:RNA polymerase sigma-70 factor, ECF subfamily